MTMNCVQAPRMKCAFPLRLALFVSLFCVCIASSHEPWHHAADTVQIVLRELKARAKVEHREKLNKYVVVQLTES